MPISSYLAIAKADHRGELESLLRAMSQVDIVPSTNKDVIVVVTDTENNSEEEALVKSINEIEILDQLTMVSGYTNN